MGSMKFFAINPGSTSTKIALFEEDNCLFSSNVSHEQEVLETFKEMKDQLGYRKETILSEVEKAGYSLEGMDAFVGRGGGLMPLEGGTYKINDVLLNHARACLAGAHPATLGSQLAYQFASEYGGKCYVVNPPDVDEFDEIARISGVKGLYRESRIHALNQKEIGLRYAASVDKKYEDINLIIAHIGGGISVTAHKKGKMVDSNDILNGEGPMAPTRCGSLAVKKVVAMCYSGKFTEREMKDKVSKNGGLIDHLGTADVREVLARIDHGDEYAKIVLDAMLYQIAKHMGSMSAALKGEVDQIVLTGGISYSTYVVDKIKEYVSYIAPVTVMAGEFEMEALAAGAKRVMTGLEEAKTYTGEPVWKARW